MKLQNPLGNRNGFTLSELMVVVPAALLCVTAILTVMWIGVRLIAQNISVNLAHVDVALPMQLLADDVHASIAMPVLTGALSSGSGVVPPGLPGGTNSVLSGKMTSWTLATASTGTAAGVSLYVVTSATAQVSSTAGNYLGNYAAFPVATGGYTSASKTLSLQLVSAADQALLQSATNGMHVCVPGATVVTTSTNMVDARITGVSFQGTASNSAATSTLVAQCTLASAIGTSFTTFGTRTTVNGYVYQAYLVAPVVYTVCGTDLVRINYDGSWKVIMRNLVSGCTSAAITPFSLPYPSALSFLSTGVGTGNNGRRAVTVRFSTTNPEYSNRTYRGGASNMMLYDITLWSRAQLYDEISR